MEWVFLITLFTSLQLQGEFAALRDEMKKAQSVIHSTPPPVDTKPYQQQINRLKAVCLNFSKSRFQFFLFFSMQLLIGLNVVLTDD